MNVKGQQIRRGGGEGLRAVQVAAWTCDRMQDAGCRTEGGGWRIWEEQQQQRWRRLLQGFKSRAGDLKGSFTGQISCHPITDCSLPRDQREEGGRAVRDVEGLFQLLLDRPVLTHKRSCSQVFSTTNTRGKKVSELVATETCSVGLCRQKRAGWRSAWCDRRGCSLLLPHLRHQSSLAASPQSKDHLQRV